MNQLKGTITAIAHADQFSVVTMDIGTSAIKAIVINTLPADQNIQLGQTIQLIFKETEVVIAKGATEHISIVNHLPARIEAIEPYAFMTRLKLWLDNHSIDAVITTTVAQRMGLQKGDEVTALIRANEIMLMESRVLNE